MNIKRELETKVGIANSIYLNNIDIPPLTIKAIMINEVVPSDPLQDFYGLPDADYLKTTIPLLQGAGTEVASIQDILQMGIYITNAVKTPKTEYSIDKSSIENSLPYLEAEISLFPNPDKPEKFLQFLQISSTIKKNVGGCVHVTHG